MHFATLKATELCLHLYTVIHEFNKVDVAVKGAGDSFRICSSECVKGCYFLKVFGIICYFCS